MKDLAPPLTDATKNVINLAELNHKHISDLIDDALDHLNSIN